MNSVTQTVPFASLASSRLGRLAGRLAIASGIAVVLLTVQIYVPASFDLLFLLITLVFFLGMVPTVVWIASGLAARDQGNVPRVAEMIGLTGVAIAVATAIFALPQWLPAVAAQILATSALGVIGLWLTIANVLGFRSRLLNRVLAALGILAGLAWLAVALTMWVELLAGDLGSLTAILEGVRSTGSYVALAFYLVWALWMGIWLVRKR